MIAAARANAWPILGIAIVLAFLGVMAAIPSCGHGETGSVGAATTTKPSATPSATVDPAEAQVRAAARTFLETEIHSGVSGDVHAADALVVPGSPADGDSASSAEVTGQTRLTFVPPEVRYIESKWKLITTTTTGAADVYYTLRGHDATFPELKPLNADHVSRELHEHMEFQRLGGKWLVYSFVLYL